MASRPDMDSTPLIPHLGPVHDEGGARRDRFAPRELAIVLSHYDLGAISRIREYRRGSRRSPKVRIESKRGEFLLKRRAPGRDDPSRAAFAQGLQVRLAEHGYPVPGLIGTRGDNSLMLQIEGRLYEVFHFIVGRRDDRSLASATSSGNALGGLHRLLREHRGGFEATTGSYHASATVERALRQIPAAVSALEPRADRAEMEASCDYLRKAYRDSARRVEELGFAGWPGRIVHGDWHPGNLLYRKQQVVAVLDFDSARVEPRMTDVANAALQFSMLPMDASEPEKWPDELDMNRLRALLDGYDQAADDPMSANERRSLFWLIVEAVVQESVIPIAANGRFAHLRGSSFLRMVERKVRWLRPRAARFVQHLEGRT